MPTDASPKDQVLNPRPLAGEGVTPTMRTLQIPFTDAPWGMIQLPYPMTTGAWDELLHWFESNASPLTKGAIPKVKEAQKT